jgi:AcrR family transcriptional regulator
MGGRASAVPARRPRADALRNREALLVAAREVFAEAGVLAPLDAIAVRAGTGNATLYRNFPTREALLSAVMESSIDEAAAEAARLAQAEEPAGALTDWLVHLTWLLRIWHDLPYCLADAQVDRDSPVATSVETLIGHTGVLLARAQGAGAARADLAAPELFQLVTATSWAVDRFGDDEPAARRRVLLMSAGLVDEPPGPGSAPRHSR